MNWDRVEGNWKQFRGRFRQKWGEITEDEYDQIAGRRDQFVGKLQERYGYARDEAERHADEFARGLSETEAAVGANGVPGVQTGGRAVDGTPDTRGVLEKVADAVTGDRVDDKTGKVVR